MKNFLKLNLALAGLALLAVPVLRAADQPPGDKADRHERREEMRENLKKMAKELNLTADQKSKIEAIHQQTHEALKALHDDTTLNEEQKHAKAKELRKSMEEQVHAILTPEQQAKAKELREKHGKHGDKGDKPEGEKPPDK